jgi:hypothetical protein
MTDPKEYGVRSSISERGRQRIAICNPTTTKKLGLCMASRRGYQCSMLSRSDNHNLGAAVSRPVTMKTMVAFQTMPDLTEDG